MIWHCTLSPVFVVVSYCMFRIPCSVPDTQHVTRSTLHTSPVTLYVAPNGNDAWSGRLAAPNGRGDGPLATFATARDRLRQMKRRGRLREGATVVARGGVYLLDRPLVFGPEDSGATRRPITYAAYPGETVVIGGGRRITGWRPAGNGLWTARVPDRNGQPWRFRQLFVNGQPQTRARHPNTDHWWEWPKTTQGFPHNDKHDPAKKIPLHYPEGALLKNWPNLADVEINILAQFRWVNAVCPLKSVDEQNRVAILARPAAYHINKNDPFRVENVVEAIDEPGEWSLNTLTRTVTLLPPRGVDMRAADVIAPALEALIKVEGTDEGRGLIRNFHLRGFTFAHAEEGVTLANVEGCSVEACRFLGLGGQAITARNYVQRCRFVGNEATECGGGGIALKGYPPGTKDVNRKNEISGNHIHHCGRSAWNAAAISLTQSGENIVRGNYVHDMPYIGIAGGGVSYVYFNLYKGEHKNPFDFRWKEIGDDPLTRESVKRFNHTRYNLIEGNVIHTVMQLLDDGGGIYLGFLGVGNVVRDNIVHGTKEGLKVGIYLDDEADGTLVEGNLVYDVARVQLSHRPNVWRNNAFYERGQSPPPDVLAAHMARQQAIRRAGVQIKKAVWNPATGLPQGVTRKIPMLPPPKYAEGLRPNKGGAFLSDLRELSWHGHAALYKDQQYGLYGPLRLGDRLYRKGLVIHPLGSTDAQQPNSRDAEVVYDFGRARYRRFRALIGIEPPAPGERPMGSATFEVYVRSAPGEEWKRVYASGTRTHASEPLLIEVNLEGARQMRLRVTDAGDDHFGDVCVWACACVD